jgi:hypothetical protein
MAADDKVYIGPALERALFVKFGNWLFVLFPVAVLIIGALASAAVYGAQLWFSKEFDKQMDDARQRIREFERYAVESAAKSGVAAKTSDEQATAAQKRSEDARLAVEKLNNDINNANVAASVVKAIQNLETTLPTRPAFVDAITAKLKITAHTVGPTGNIDLERDQDLDFAGQIGECTGGLCSKLIEHSEQFTFCGLTYTQFHVVAASGYYFQCDVARDQASGKWKVRFSQATAVCRIMCLR